MFPKSHSIEIRTALMDLLRSSISWLGTVILNGACRCIRNGYAGSPYKHIGDPAGENACRCSISSSLESASMPESCFFPSEMNKTSVELMPYLKSTMYFILLSKPYLLVHTNWQSFHLEVLQLENLKHVSFCVHCRQLFDG